MSANFFTDSKGRYHRVLRQSYANSCGPTCIAMVSDAYKQICSVDPEGHAIMVSHRYEGYWKSEKGIELKNIVSVLNAEGVKAYSEIKTSPGKGVYAWLYAYARVRTPAIVQVQTRSGNMHVVVCPSVYADGTTVFLDPDFGLYEEMLQAGLGRYRDGWLTGSLIITYW